MATRVCIMLRSRLWHSPLLLLPFRGLASNPERPRELRSRTCGALSAAHVGEHVELAGWVQAVRDLGPLVFISLRDAYGVTQLKVQAGSVPDEMLRAAKALRPESVVRAWGPVVARPRELANASQRSGDIELSVERLDVLSAVSLAHLPFAPGAVGASVSEDVRLTHRPIDLRSGALQRNIRLRSAVSMAMRMCLHSRSPPFVEVETPTLFRSSPEGAREFLVPTRQPGRAYALAQSPQQYKQMLMAGGVDRYFQFARCYRDESGRADRQPEFTQVDLELALVTQEGVMAEVEGLVDAAFRAAGALAGTAAAADAARGDGGLPPGSRELLSRHEYLSHALPPLVPWRPLPLPLPRITYTHALSCYGSDKPDRRFGMPISEAAGALASAVPEDPPAGAPLSALLHTARLAAAGQCPPARAVAADSTDLTLFLPERLTVRAFAVPCLGGPGVLSRKQLDALVSDMCQAAGAVPGGGDRWGGAAGDPPSPRDAPLACPVLHCVRVGAGSSFPGSQALAATLPPAGQAALCAAAGAAEGDLLVLVAGPAPRAYTAAGTARLIAAEVLRRKGLPLPPNVLLPPGSAAGVRAGESVIAGRQLDAGYTPLPAKDVAAAVALRARVAGGAAPPPVVVPTASSVDVFWVVDFPLFELSEGGALSSVHHPFTAPSGLTASGGEPRAPAGPSDADRLREWLSAHPSRAVAAAAPEAAATAAAALGGPPRDPSSVAPLLTLRAQHYDLVSNGVELGGGSIRIHDAALQAAVLRDALAVSPAQLESFGALLAALAAGAPPHGGFALGFDRLAALLAGHAAAPSIRDVIAFPKSAAGNDPLTGAPAAVSRAALAEFHVVPLG